MSRLRTRGASSPTLETIPRTWCWLRSRRACTTMQNGPRTILTAGISNKQWEGVVTPSSTPHLTESSPTLSPTPSPTCAFSTVSGQCNCGVRLHQQPKLHWDYSASDHYVICIEQGTALHMLEFLTEQDYDLLWVNGQSCSYTEGPDGVEVEGQIEWTSDTQGTEKGWSICTDAPTPSPTSSISVSQRLTPMIGAFQAQISQKTKERCFSAASPSMWTPSSTWLSSRSNFSYDVLVDVRENPAAQSGWIHQVPDRWPCEVVYGCSLCSSIPARGCAWTVCGCRESACWVSC